MPGRDAHGQAFVCVCLCVCVCVFKLEKGVFAAAFA